MWFNRTVLGWGTLYLASRVLGAICWRWYARVSGGGLWNDHGACELEHHDTLLLPCQQRRMIAYKKYTQKVVPHILSIHISPCPTTCSFRPLPFGLGSSLTRSPLPLAGVGGFFPTQCGHTWVLTVGIKAWFRFRVRVGGSGKFGGPYGAKTLRFSAFDGCLARNVVPGQFSSEGVVLPTHRALF